MDYYHLHRDTGHRIFGIASCIINQLCSVHPPIHCRLAESLRRMERHRAVCVGLYVYYTRRYGYRRGQYAVNGERIKVGPVLATLNSSLMFPRRSVTTDLLPTIGAGLNTRDTIKGQPNVDTEHGAAVGKKSGIIVDDVSDFLARLWTMDDPVMSVEWRLGTVRSKFEDQETDEGQVEEKNWNLLEAGW